ncbi:MAG: hypothetical protein Q9191_005368, partial [Dirinaria sp. TL-2023a]
MLEDYQDIALEDYESKDAKKKQFSKEWIKLSESSGKQWQKWLDIRSKLEQYSQGGPIRYNVATLFQYTAPPRPQLDALRTWLADPREGQSFLRSADEYIWDSKHEYDLISLRKDACQDDPFSKWLADYPLDTFHNYISPSIWRSRPCDEESGGEPSGFVRYSDIKLARLSFGLSTGLASMFVVTSVIVLNSITRTLIRLIMIAVFAFLFSLIMFVFTNARKIEVFAATCA